MPKNESSSNRPIVKSAGKVNVFNTGTQQVAVGIRVHNSKPGDVGQPIRAVKFLPGNNEVDADDWEICKSHATVKSWLSSIDQLNHNGTLSRARVLIENHVDPRFESTSTVLAERMYASQQVIRQAG